MIRSQWSLKLTFSNSPARVVAPQLPGQVPLMDGLYDKEEDEGELLKDINHRTSS